ncbi:MAG: helical backbone metal receptor [Elusimicrobiota bacterium]
MGKKVNTVRTCVLILLCLQVSVSVLVSGSNSEKLPQRIVSLSPAVTANIYALGAQDKIIGVTAFCDYPREAKKKNVVGTWVEPNLEKIISLKPDIIIAAEWNNPGIVDKLKKLGLNVAQLPNESSFQEISTNFLKIAQLTGKEEYARKLLAGYTKKLENYDMRLKGKNRPTVFWVLGTDPLITVGSESFVNEIIIRAGGENVNKLNTAYQRYNRETAVAQNPEMIVIVSMGKVAEAELEEWKKYQTLKAVKNNRIYVINDPRVVCAPTPEAFVAGVETVGKYFHPDVFVNKEKIVKRENKIRQGKLKE